MNPINLITAVLFKRAYSAEPQYPVNAYGEQEVRGKGIPRPAGEGWVSSGDAWYRPAPGGQSSQQPTYRPQPRMRGEEAINRHRKSLDALHSAPIEDTEEAVVSGYGQRSQDYGQAFKDSNRQLDRVNDELGAIRNLRESNPRAYQIQAARIKARYGYSPNTDTVAARYGRGPELELKNPAAPKPQSQPPVQPKPTPQLRPQLAQQPQAPRTPQPQVVRQPVSRQGGYVQPQQTQPQQAQPQQRSRIRRYKR
jgi:hypothetical protein